MPVLLCLTCHNNNTIYVPFPQSTSYDEDGGDFALFFHEVGHAVDWNSRGSGSYTSSTYKNAKGQRLIDCIRQDVYNNIVATVKEIGGTNEQAVNIALAVMYGDVSNDLNKEEKMYFKDVKDLYYTRLYSFIGPSDVYEGITGGVLKGNWGHGVSYWDDGQIAAECWGTFYSNMIRRRDGGYSKFLPSASRFMEEMAYAMRG